MKMMAVLWVIVATTVAGGEVITVDDDGPADFNNIAAAIEHASHGDEIVLEPGVYAGTGNCGLEFGGKSITLRSRYGPDVTVIDCGGEYFGIEICDNWTAPAGIKGLTIRRSHYGAIKVCSSTPPRGSYSYSPGYAPVTIADCNFVESDYSSILMDGHDNVTVIRCRIVGGERTGIYSFMSGPQIRNCVVAANASYGIQASWAQVSNCTVVGNGSIGIYMSGGSAVNCIVRDNGLAQIRDTSGSATVTYSNVSGGWVGAGNIDCDPCFADADANDYHLRSRAGRWDDALKQWVTDDVCSACIDAGDPASAIGFEPFPNGGRVNIGAYGATNQASKSYFGGDNCQTIVAGDINGDCKVDFRDFVILAMQWGRNEPPSVSIVRPAYNDDIYCYQQDEPVVFEAEAFDPGGAVVKVEFFVDGQQVGEEIGKIGEDTDGGDGWSAEWIWWGDWGHYNEGTYKVSAVATDDGGTSVESNPVTFHIYGPK